MSMPLVVRLTTLPSRLDHLRPTLESLTRQTRVPDRILLCLPRWSRREQQPYIAPAWLADFAPLLSVVDCGDDYGPGTKLLGALPCLAEPSCLVIADDDMRYARTFLQHLYEHQVADTSASFSYYTFSNGYFPIGQGADGISCFGPNLQGIMEFALAVARHPQLFVVDDLWISAFLWRRGVAMKSLAGLVGPDGRIYEESHALNQLRALQGDLSRRTAMWEGLNYMLEQGLLGRRNQIIAQAKRLARGIRARMRG
jgi:hypothetical protein